MVLVIATPLDLNEKFKNQEQGGWGASDYEKAISVSEKITVPAGTFDCNKLVFEWKDSTEHEINYMYYDDMVGKIKEDHISFRGTDTIHRVTQLVYYKLN